MKLPGYYDSGAWYGPVEIERLPSARGCRFQPTTDERRAIGQLVRAGHVVRFAGLEHVAIHRGSPTRRLLSYVLVEVDGRVRRAA